MLVLVVGVSGSMPAHAQPVSDGEDSSEASTEMPLSLPGKKEVLEAESSAPSTERPPLALEAPIDPKHYVCGPGDEFELNFWGRQNFQLQFAADLEGRAFISKIGYVRVAGRTLAHVRKLIRQRVRRSYPGLEFDLVLAQPRTFVVHVVGNVKQPGSYPSRPLERVSSVVDRAGIAGSKRRIAIRRRGSVRASADLLLYELTGDTKHNPYVLDGDIIDIPLKGVVVEVGGAVYRPGTYELIKTKDTTELIELAGGFRSSVAKNLPVRLLRRNERQHASVSEIRFDREGKLPSVPLRDEDALAVRGTEELQRTILLIGALVGASPVDTATASKRLTFVEGDTVYSLIGRAGGITSPGDLSRAYISRPRPGRFRSILPINLEALLVRKDMSADRPIRLGDEIVVPNARRGVLVEGAVRRPDLYDFNPQFGIQEYLAQAGGRTRIAAGLDDIKLVRPSGKTYRYDPERATSVHPGDAILVPERNFSRGEIAQIWIAAAGLALSTVALSLSIAN